MAIYLLFFLADPEDASSSVIYKLDKKISISKIVFAPRNDDNFVWPGDSYELFYQNGVNGWESLGIQKPVMIGNFIILFPKCVAMAERSYEGTGRTGLCLQEREAVFYD